MAWRPVGDDPTLDSRVSLGRRLALVRRRSLVDACARDHASPRSAGESSAPNAQLFSSSKLCRICRSMELPTCGSSSAALRRSMRSKILRRAIDVTSARLGEVLSCRSVTKAAQRSWRQITSAIAFGMFARMTLPVVSRCSPTGISGILCSGPNSTLRAHAKTTSQLKSEVHH